MPRPRIHKDNAARQKAYRERRKAAREADGYRALVQRVMAADAAAKDREGA